MNVGGIFKGNIIAVSYTHLLNEGKDVFYVVGAAHMGGKKGIISLLEQRGYTVEKIEYRN